MLKNKDVSGFQSQMLYVMLINVKMPTIVGISYIYEDDKFHAQLSMKKDL